MPTSSIASPSKIYKNLDFWFENKPSGNPGHDPCEKIWPNFEFASKIHLSVGPEKGLTVATNLAIARSCFFLLRPKKSFLAQAQLKKYFLICSGSLG
jgi:hypothetical protein